MTRSTALKGVWAWISRLFSKTPKKDRREELRAEARRHMELSKVLDGDGG
jgi:hypothetical protein